MSAVSNDWIMMGGRRGEVAHCQRCGVGLEMRMPQTVNVMLGAIKGFTKDHVDCEPGDDPNPEVVTRDNWPRSRDTGTSSWTIYSVMRGMDSPDACYGVPQDPSDFGRCYRLLKLFPEWKPKLHEVATRFPEWTSLVREWSNLETLYEAIVEHGDRSKLYLLIQDLICEGKAK